MATAIAKTTDPDHATQQHFELIPLARVDADPEQPRKTFDPKKLAELAESVRVHGVVVPITVRPNPSKGEGWYVLIAGERRVRASKLAGKTDIPAVIDETKYSASELLERQLLENSDREDVPPLEEAETYARLLKLPGYTMDLLIAKTGKSKAHLYGRLKLLELAPAVRKAVVAGKLPPAHAELIARIGDVKLQEQCMQIVLGLDLHKIEFEGEQMADEWLEDHGIQHELVSEDGDRVRYAMDDAQPLSFRATKALIRQRFTTKLALAKFNPADAKLTAAGACTSCPHRSGNQPELPGVVDAKGDDLCLRPACFEEKHRATFKAAAAAAKDRGVKVVDKAEKVFGYDGVGIAHDSPYVDLDTPLPYDLQKTPGKAGTFGKLLGKAVADIPKVLVQDESGAPRELLDRKAAIAKLTELGKVDKPTSKPSSGAHDYKADRAKERAKSELQGATLTRALGDAAERIAKGDVTKLTGVVRWLARAAIRDYAMSGGDGGDAVLKRRGLEDYDQLEELAVKAKTATEALAIVFELYLGIHSDAKVNGWTHNRKAVDLFEDGLKVAGVDWMKALAAAKEAAKAEQKSDAAKDAKKTPAKKGKKS